MLDPLLSGPLKRWAESKNAIASLWLFGSRAKGNHNIGAISILLLNCDRPTDPMIGRLENTLRVPISGKQTFANCRRESKSGRLPRGYRAPI